MNQMSGPKIVLLLIVLSCGCAEGPLWQTGYYVPWVKEKWAAEEQLADTFFERKRELNRIVELATTIEQQDAAAKQLTDIIRQEPVLLIRLHAVELLSGLSNQESAKGLEIASRDPEPKIRLAAARSLGNLAPEMSIGILQGVIGSDTNVDVRLAATKSLAKFNDVSTLQALSMALVDTDPAIQFTATESLEKITGQEIGADVSAWQAYLKETGQIRTATSPTSSSIR